jgi:M6 family metalloprotease-like protein
MKPARCLSFLVAFLTTAWAVPAAEQPQKLLDLSDYRTVETALTTRIVPASQQVINQPGYLGINLDSAQSERAVIAQVEPQSPADRAGLRAGDVVREIDGKVVGGPGSLRDQLQGRLAGEELRFVVMRKDGEQRLKVVLGAVSRPMRANGQRAILGVETSSAEGGGARIERVVAGSPAAFAGIRLGDVLLKVDGQLVSNDEQLSPALNKKQPGDVVTLTVKRDRKELDIQATLAAEPGAASKSFSWDTRFGIFKKDVYRLAVIPIEFADVKHNKAITTREWDRAVFSRTSYTETNATGQPVFGSLHDFYHEQSCGKFRIEGKVFEPVEVARKRQEYVSDANRHALLTEAFDLVQARARKDVLGDFDGLSFIYAGERVQTSRGNLFWPHRSTFPHRERRWSYFICAEGGEKMTAVGVLAHEFGHLVGLPDLYTRPENPNFEGVGVWCTMASGGKDSRPLHLSAWCKEQLVWLTPTLIDPSVKQKLILAPVEKSARECFKVLVRADGSEYLLLENRTRKGFDRNLPGEGLLIWRVVNGRVQLEVSHGSTGPGSATRFLGSVPYPSPANNAFTPATTPSSKSADPGARPVYITNIQRLLDGRVAFLIGFEFF